MPDCAYRGVLPNYCAFLFLMDSPQSLHRPRSKWPVFLFLLVLLGSAGFGGYSYWKRQQAKQHAFRFGSIPMPDRIARVPDDWSLDTLAGRLQKTGKVHDATAFEEVADGIGLKTIAAGAYELPARATPLELARVFKAGPTLARVTFPEGFTGWQIAARLKKMGFTGADAFQTLVYPAGKPSPYEGTLFPKTYDLPFDAPAKTLLTRLQKQFEQTLKSLPRPFPKVNGKPLSTREIVTMASLIEREAASSEEMPLVASVIVNRLNAPMRLQIDAALLYARLQSGQGHKTRLTYADLKAASPYNTYQNDGLPPSPICNPGEAALIAAAKPAKTDALYYVYSPFLKRSRFAHSYSDHLKNVKLAAKERDATTKP